LARDAAFEADNREITSIHQREINSSENTNKPERNGARFAQGEKHSHIFVSVKENNTTILRRGGALTLEGIRFKLSLT